MTVKQLEAQVETARQEHAVALKTGIEHQIQAAWNRYALAKNTFMEAYFGGAD